MTKRHFAIGVFILAGAVVVFLLAPVFLANFFIVQHACASELTISLPNPAGAKDYVCSQGVVNWKAQVRFQILIPPGCLTETPPYEGQATSIFTTNAISLPSGQQKKCKYSVQLEGMNPYDPRIIIIGK